LKVDNFVKTVYTNKGFRWKTLINDPITGKRAQILQLVTPASDVKRKEPITIKAALLI
jgi:hypothetical protein